MELFRRLAAGPALAVVIALPGCVPAPDPVVASPIPPTTATAGYVQPVRASEVDLWRGINDRGLTLDVRGPEEWNDALGHLDGAVQIPFADLEARVGEIAGFRERPVLVICRDGNRARASAQHLSRAGFRDVSWVDGGMQAYHALMEAR